MNINEINPESFYSGMHEPEIVTLNPVTRELSDEIDHLYSVCPICDPMSGQDNLKLCRKHFEQLYYNI
jgi:hypothetical protein